MATSNYPGSLDDYSTLPSSGTPITVSSHYFGPAITNIEAELGTDPAGSFTDVKSRLDDVDKNVITEIDKWRISTDVNDAGFDYFGSWTQHSDMFSVKGSGLTNSSGTFSFPSTGYYRINYKIYMQNPTTTAIYAGGYITYTTDSFASVNRRLAAAYNNAMTTGEYAHVTIDVIIKISDTSNQKVRFYYETQNGITYRSGSTYEMRTGFNCVKIGEL